MRRIIASTVYEDEFWNLYDNGEDWEKLEEIISELGYDKDFFVEGNEQPTATEAQYKEVLDMYKENGGHAVYNDQQVLDMVIDACYNIDGASVSSFEDAGVMTRNKGFVLRIGDKSYQFEMLGTY